MREVFGDRDGHQATSRSAADSVDESSSPAEVLLDGMVPFEYRRIAQRVHAEALIDGNARTKPMKRVVLDLFRSLTQAGVASPGESDRPHSNNEPPAPADSEFVRAVNEWLSP